MHKITICQRSDHWLVCTTDGRMVFTRHRYITAAKALAGVARHLQAGHRIAWQRALDRLTEAATGRR